MLAHLVPALIVQLLVTLLTRHYAAGAAGGCVWAVSREIAQAEYRWIEQFGGGLRANMPWWGALEPRVWHADAMVDWLFPTVAVIAIAYWMDRRAGAKPPAKA